MASSYKVKGNPWKEGKALHIFLSVGDASADLYASLLVKEVLALGIQVEFWGIGGPRMREAGVRLLYEATRRSAIGIIAALPHLLPMLSVFRRTVHWLKWHRPDAFVALNFGAFNRRLTMLTAQMGIPTVYYIPPGFWVKKLDAVRRYIHPNILYVPIYDWQREMLLKAGAGSSQVVYMGHPLADVIPIDLGRKEAERRLGLPHKPLWGRPIRIALLPGSRICEARDNLPVMIEAIKYASLLTGISEIELLCVRAPTVSESDFVELLSRVTKRLKQFDVLIFCDRVHDVLMASDVAIAVTGTVTLEAALLGVPTIAIFTTNWLNRLSAIIIHKMSLPFSEWGYVALPNRLLGKRAMPEFALWSCTPKRVGEQIAEWLTDTARAEAVANELLNVRRIIGEGGTSKRVAELVIKLALKAKVRQGERQDGVVSSTAQFWGQDQGCD